MTRAHTTTNHDHIRKWAESRGGHPATVASTGEHGLLRIDFDPPDDALEEVDWDTFFETFDRKQLAFLYQDETADGEPSRFNKFIERYSTEAEDLSEDNDIREASASGSKASKPSKSSTQASDKNKAGGKSKVKSHAESEDEEVDEEDWDEDEAEEDEDLDEDDE